MNDFSSLRATLGIKFKNPKLLEQSFIHRSYLNESKLPLESNERLEFLGDSVLSLIVSDYLFTQRKGDAEGDLTNLRAYIVKTKSLSQAANKLHLGKYLKLSKGEEVSGGRENPQLLANTFEAVLGSIYLDSGFENAKEFVYKILLPIFAEEIEKGPPKDSKSTLQELVQEKFKKSPQYRIVSTEGPDHAKKFLVAVFVDNKEMGRGEGSSKQEAEEISAHEALKELSR